MSAIHIDNRLVHYEVVGRRGAPVIFLHSWLGSWRYWLPTMEHASERYRTFALDFWGFGESDRRDGAFSIAEYVGMVIDFMNHLGIAKRPWWGMDWAAWWRCALQTSIQIGSPA
jgi:pimeloyl-ACP methyl ester carboxylesterase